MIILGLIEAILGLTIGSSAYLLVPVRTMSTDKATLDDLRINRPDSPASRGRLGWLWILLLLLVVAAIIYFWFNRPHAPVVRTATVQVSSSGGSQTLLNASGYVVARREATVSSKVTGKVVDILVEEGMRVEADQILARLDASNVDKSLNLAKAQAESARKALDETRANLEQAERELQRVIQLAADQIASQSELDGAEAAAKSLRARLARQMADVAVSESEVALWKQQYEDTIIRAPFPGIVISKNAQPGEMISPMSAGGGFTRTGICTIVDMSSLEIEVDVNESYINRVQPDQPVVATLDSYPDWRVPAQVIAIIPTADRQKATVKVRVGFDKLDPRILPEMSVKVAFQSPETSDTIAQVMTIPASAIRSEDGRDLVWVVQNDTLERRAVQVGSKTDGDVTILAGLSRGEKVVVDGPAPLVDGATVREEIP